MNPLRYLSVSLLILGLLIGPATVHSQAQGTAPEDAQRVLESYFYHLQNGNTLDLLNLITGPLLAKRERLLRDNRQYGPFLRDRYKSAQFSISLPAFMHNNKLSLKAAIDVYGQDKMNLIFSFDEDSDDGTLKICSEKEIQ
jgi:hypothetical protein